MQSTEREISFLTYSLLVFARKFGKPLPVVAWKWKSDLDLEHSFGEDYLSYYCVRVLLKSDHCFKRSSDSHELIRTLVRWAKNWTKKSKSTSKQKKKPSKKTKLLKEDMNHNLLPDKSVPCGKFTPSLAEFHFTLLTWMNVVLQTHEYCQWVEPKYNW